MKLAWLPAAWRSLDAQLDYIAQDGPVAAVGQGDRVMEAATRLADFPESGRMGRVPGTRELVVRGTPFIIAYRVREEDVVILRVLHGAQRWPSAF